MANRHLSDERNQDIVWTVSMEWNLPARLDEIDATGLQTWKDNNFIIIIVNIVIISTYGIIFENTRYIIPRTIFSIINRV